MKPTQEKIQEMEKLTGLFYALGGSIKSTNYELKEFINLSELLKNEI